MQPASQQTTDASPTRNAAPNPAAGAAARNSAADASSRNHAGQPRRDAAPEFAGFPRDAAYIPTPAPLFGPLLEQIDDIAELKVTLRGLWLLQQRRTGPRVIPLEEFLADRTLLRGLAGDGRDAAAEIRRGLRLAVRRGTWLLYRGSGNGNGDDVGTAFALNNEAGRRAIAKLRESGGPPPPAPEDAPGEPPQLDGRPNIFALYEDNIGLLTPILAEELQEAESRYPRRWIQDAFAIAAADNRRNWRYIAAILRRWAAQGKDGWDGEDQDYGKSGGHPAAARRQKFVADYQRRWGPSSGTSGGTGGGSGG